MINALQGKPMDKCKEKQVYLWLQNQQSSGKYWLSLTSICGIMHGLLTACQAALLAWIISDIIVKHPPVHSLLTAFIFLAATMAAKSFCQWGKSVYGYKAGRSVRENIRLKTLEKIKRQGPLSLNRHTTGQWISLLQENINQLQEFYSHYLPQLKIISFVPAIILIIAFIFNWAVGLIFLITAPLIPIFMALAGQQAAAANRKNFQLLSQLSGYFLNRLQGLSTLRLFNRSKQEREAIAEATDNFRVQTMRVLRLAFLSSAILEFFASISIALTAVYLGMSYLGHLHFGNWGYSLTVFTGFFLLLLAPEFYQSLRDLGTYYHAKAQAIGAGETLMEFLDTPDTDMATGKQILPKTQQFHILFEDVSVKADNDNILLHNISFTLSSGEHLVLAGASGAGKSTLLNTLLGFHSYTGSIKINGYELRQLDLSTYHSRIAWLNQNPTLIYGTVRENIELGSKSLSREAINQVLRQAQVTEFIQQMPEGQDTLLGENAQRVSTGQAQRISLARMLSREGQLLLLDEPTASLDRHSEALVNEQLTLYSKNRSRIIATHRIGHMIDADKIILLDSGRIKDTGSFTKLKTHSDAFKALLTQWQMTENLTGLRKNSSLPEATAESTDNE